MSNLKFLKNFLLRPADVGAVWPSSRHLCRELTLNVGLENARAAVELGPGTGAATSHILRRLPPNARFFAVEINPELERCFREAHPGVTIHNDDAANLPELLRRENIERLDTVVSGLPFASFPERIQDQVLDAVRQTLRDGGHFTTFAYLQGTLLPAGVRFNKKLRQTFAKVRKSRVEWRNLPPAFCYRCQK